MKTTNMLEIKKGDKAQFYHSTLKAMVNGTFTGSIKSFNGLNLYVMNYEDPVLKRIGTVAVIPQNIMSIESV